MGENICKQRKSINFQNIQTAHAAQYQNHPIKKWGNYLNKTFLQGDIQMVKKHMKRCSASIINREIQIKTIYNEVSPHTSQDGHLSKDLQIINARE